MPGSALELKNTILRAGAGAGKTTTLTHLFLDYAAGFLDEKGHFPRVVVTTFTRKATQELKERLLLLALQRQRQDLFYYVTNKSLVQISTIHGVLSLFLGRHGHRMGLSSDFQLVSTAQDRLLRRKILRRLILNDPETEALLETYSFSQMEQALDAYYEKSFLLDRFERATPEIFAAELRADLRKLDRHRHEVAQAILVEASEPSWIKYAEGLGRLRLDREAAPAQVMDRVEAFFEEHPRRPSYRVNKPAVDEATNEKLVALVTDLKALMESPECLPEYWEKHELENRRFAQLAERFRAEILQQKLHTGRISMADLELLSLKLVKDLPEAAAAFSAEWDYWMIDEYQDTSPVQVALLEALVGNRKSFIVGDPQQSIYLFRGARSEVFDEKMLEIAEEEGDVQEKLVNYRSVPPLLHFINYYFSPFKGLFAAMIPGPSKDGFDSSTCVAQLRVVEKAEALSGLSEETKAALDRIQGLLSAGVSAEKICVLARTRDGLETLGKAAEAYGVPVQVHIAGGFYHRPEIRDALLLLKFLINPHDNQNFLACLRSPWIHLPDQEILAYCHRDDDSFWSVAQNHAEALPSRHPVRLLQAYLQASRDNGYSRTLRKMLVELGIFDSVQMLDPAGRREANLWKLVSQLFEQEGEPGFNFLDFFSGQQQALDLDSAGEDSDAAPVIAPQRVNLMTIHASKGLQFEHVVVLGLTKKPRLSHADLFSVDEESGDWSLSLIDEDEKKTQPSMLAVKVKERFNERELEEHFRVLYVALTRAKGTLTLIWEGKPEKNSWAERCPLLLSEGLHQEKDFCYEVLNRSFAPEIRARAETLHEADPGPWQTAPPSPGLELVAVTQLIANQMTEASRGQKAPDLQKALAKAYRGTEAHRLFEALKYSTPDEMADLARDEETRKALKFLLSTRELPMAEILKHGFVEWGFSFREGDVWVRGQIDLWGVVDGAVWIVDYKTGSSLYSEKAFDQLKAYAWALLRMGFIKPPQAVHLAVLYPFEEQVKISANLDLRPWQ